MYLSRIQLPTQAFRSLTHLGAYHHWVESQFPEEIETHQRSRKLWRLDGQTLYLVSQTPPKELPFKNYQPFLESLKEGQQGLFQVTLCPSVTKDDKRIFLRSEESQLAYLEKRANRFGFQLNHQRIVQSQTLPLYKTGHPRIDLLQVSYQGQLTITNLDRFKKTLTQGFGHHKAYGAGLLTFIPLRR